MSPARFPAPRRAACWSRTRPVSTHPLLANCSVPDGRHRRRERSVADSPEAPYVHPDLNPVAPAAPKSHATPPRHASAVRVNLTAPASPGLPPARLFDHYAGPDARHGMIGSRHPNATATCTSTGTTRSGTSASRLGQAVRRHGDRAASGATATATFRLDEALPRRAVDSPVVPAWCWRPSSPAPWIGGFDTQPVHEFFQGFCQPRPGHAAHRQPEGERQRAPPSRD